MTTVDLAGALTGPLSNPNESTSHSSGNLYYVSHSNSPFVKKDVHAEAPTCNCVYRDQMQMPCCHLIRVLAFINRRERIIDCFHPMYLFKNYKDTVANVSYKLPLFDEAISHRTVLAPLVVRRHGRPGSRRIASKGEGGGKKTTAKPRSRVTVDFDIENGLDFDVHGDGDDAGPQPRTYKCSKCGKEGHNAATCKKRASKFVPATSSGKSHLRQNAAPTPLAMKIASIVNPTARIRSLDFEFESDSASDESTADEADHEVDSLGFDKGPVSAPARCTVVIPSTDIV